MLGFFTYLTDAKWIAHLFIIYEKIKSSYDT